MILGLCDNWIHTFFAAWGILTFTLMAMGIAFFFLVWLKNEPTNTELAERIRVSRQNKQDQELTRNNPFYFDDDESFSERDRTSLRDDYRDED